MNLDSLNAFTVTVTLQSVLWKYKSSFLFTSKFIQNATNTITYNKAKKSIELREAMPHLVEKSHIMPKTNKKIEKKFKPTLSVQSCGSKFYPFGHCGPLLVYFFHFTFHFRHICNKFVTFPTVFISYWFNF